MSRARPFAGHLPARAWLAGAVSIKHVSSMSYVDAAHLLAICMDTIRTYFPASTASGVRLSRKPHRINGLQLYYATPCRLGLVKARVKPVVKQPQAAGGSCLMAQPWMAPPVRSPGPQVLGKQGVTAGWIACWLLDGRLPARSTTP